MPKNLSFEDMMVLKTIDDDFTYETCGPALYRYRRKIRPAAYATNAMESLATSFKFELSNTQRIIIEAIERYSNHFNVKGSPKEILNMIDSDISEMKQKNSTNGIPTMTATRSISNLASNIRLMVKECDKINEFTQMAYRVSEQKDHRFNDVTAKDILDDPENVFSSMQAYLKDVESNEPKNTDVYTAEYGKIVCKKVKAFKAMIISVVNKYFGKNSKLAELNIYDLIIS